MLSDFTKILSLNLSTLRATHYNFITSIRIMLFITKSQNLFYICLNESLNDNE